MGSAEVRDAHQYHLFFIHLSISGCLGCVHVFVIVSNDAIQMRVLISFELVLLFSSDVYPEVELLDPMVALF